mmetsp:Transcript_9434/g.40061  ORF Transcript_9434/g.40061 Transcript_9434/m.40061 type:complete len:255 (+) Transcript_9434:256-1020(+)
MSASYPLRSPHATKGTTVALGHFIVPAISDPASSRNIPPALCSNTRRSAPGSNPSGGQYPWHTTNASIDELRELLGFAHVTSLKNSLSCAYSNPMSLPRKIFATYAPPCFRTCVATVSPARMSCACMNSSMSCRPVTSGAPSLTMRSARRPSPKCDKISRTLAMDVMSPCSCTTPSIGAIGCRSMATILGKSSSFTPASRAGRYTLRLSTCDQLPGAAHRSTTCFTPVKMSKLSSICSSLNALRARHPSSLALR